LQKPILVNVNDKDIKVVSMNEPNPEELNPQVTNTLKVWVHPGICSKQQHYKSPSSFHLKNLCDPLFVICKHSKRKKKKKKNH